FRLPARVLDEEIDMIVGMGADVRYGAPIDSMKALLTEGYDAVFVGAGAPKGKNLEIPGRREGAANIHIGIEWLEAIPFGHVGSVGDRVLIIGVGNTAMDCCRSSRRLGGKDIKVMARRPRGYFKASEWELEDAEEEMVEIVINHSPKSFVVEDGRLRGMQFERLEWTKDAKGRMTSTGLDTVFLPADDVILAIGQENAVPWIERDLGIEFGADEVPVVDKVTMEPTRPGVFFGGDAAFGPLNIIWAVAHGHEAAISIHNLCHGISVRERPKQGMRLNSQKMGHNQWSYSNDYSAANRAKIAHLDLRDRFRRLDLHGEPGF